MKTKKEQRLKEQEEAHKKLPETPPPPPQDIQKSNDKGLEPPQQLSPNPS